MNALQHTRNELNLCLKQDQPDRSYRDTLLSPFHPQKIKGWFTGDPKLAVPLLGGQPLKDKIVFVLAKGKLKRSYSFRAVSDASQQRALNRSDRNPSHFASLFLVPLASLLRRGSRLVFQ